MSVPHASSRLHQLDALRVIAFGLLIFYHSGMLYVSWGFHVKSPRLVPGLEWGMVLLNPWRLGLLMFISGVASRCSLDKLGGRRFAWNRVRRLLPPLIFGMLVVVPPQTYFQLRQAGTWSGSYLSFWTQHYLAADRQFGTPMPTWNHLWFIPYLLAYGLGLALLAPVLGRLRRGEPRSLPVRWLLVGPAIWLAATNVLASEVYPDTHAFADDFAGHARWVGLFGFGVAAARSADFWSVLRRRRRAWTTLALGTACVFLAVRVAIHAGRIGDSWSGPLYETASGFFGWSAILALLAQASHHLDRESTTLRSLNEAVLPVYVLHQTVLICLAMWVFPLRWPLGVEAALIVLGTFVICWATYELLLRRSRVLGWLLGLPWRRALAAGLILGCSSCATTARSPADTSCRPEDSCWPGTSDWNELRRLVNGHLQASTPRQAPADGADPFARQEAPAGTQSTGWLDAWTAAPSPYAVIAESVADVSAAVRFARAHRVALVIKGTGHDYLGRSTNPDALMVWTHHLRTIELVDGFVPRGCAPSTAPAPAVSVGAGARWGEVYRKVTVEGHRYVQGGGCTSVGAAGGFLQGGGFGSWSRKYGTSAANLLEAEVVTADGEVRVANACQNADLFWALRGGGGGTFGVVTRATMRTHPLPETLGFLGGTFRAQDDAAFEELVQRFTAFAGARLLDAHWGEQVQVRPGNELEVSMTFLGMTAEEAKAAWAPLTTWVRAHPERVTGELSAVALPADKVWDREFLEKREPDSIATPSADPHLFWWTDDAAQVGVEWSAYQSMYVPAREFTPAHARALGHVLFAASRQFPLGINFNKGQAGADAEAVARDRETSMNPQVLDAAALVIVSAADHPRTGLGPLYGYLRQRWTRAGVRKAMAVLRAAMPHTGSYVNEADYFEPGWQRSFWGTNYDRLLQIKRKYDPSGLFRCHHCVGSDPP